MPTYNVHTVIQSDDNLPVSVPYGKDMDALTMMNAVTAALSARDGMAFLPQTLSVTITVNN